MAKNGANLLVNLTNDAWYGRSSAPYQHFSKSVFRAVENRRALVRSANTGISGFIQPTGKVMEETPLFEEAVTTRAVPLFTETSFYTRYGDLLPSACLAALLMLGLIAFKKRNRTQTK
jgi:apolipoprotein N-acyltransferase